LTCSMRFAAHSAALKMYVETNEAVYTLYIRPTCSLTSCPK
jgi:hypothetical protein